MENNLKKKTVVGMVWSTLQRFGRMGIAFVANLVMARLLSPEDYGAMGILMVFIAVSLVFVDAGFGNALIQKKDPTKEDYSTIFYFNLIVSGVIFLILFFAAPAIAKFYDMEILCGLLRALSLVLIIDALSLIQNCRMRKEMNFKVLSLATLVSAMLGAGAGIYTAINGYGVWSLVIYTLVESATRTIVLWVMCHWMPNLCFSWDSLKQLFKFGSFLLANSLLFTLRRNAVAMFMGKLYQPSDLGYYTQAKKLEEVPVTSIQTIIGQVTFPLFAVVKSNASQLKAVQRKSNILLAFLCVPLMLLFIVLAHDLIIGLFTEKWAEAEIYFQVLCVCGIFVSLQEVNANVITALGYSGLYFKWSIIKTALLFFLLFAGSFIGIYGMLLAWCIQNVLAYLINAVLSGRYTGYSLWQQTKDLLPIYGISVISGIAVWAVGSFFDLNIWVNMTLQILLFGVLYLSGFYLIKKSYITEFLEAVKVIKK
ncbi:MAG: lipopolysaccharide biosynthesis protein [Bacteroidales bacterium]|nr:lipopolysaccharide biosynthesis protein [Bacteroidales bacterium]MBR6929725.1 lipopolysaccharide biosynthesis protein [Bacteroidales bacterium]